MKNAFTYASIGLAVTLLYVLLHFGMLPALISLCVAYLLAQALAGTSVWHHLGHRGPGIAAALVGLFPILVFTSLALGITSTVPNIQGQFSGLTDKLAHIVATWKAMLPPAVADKIPGDAALNDMLVHALKERAGAIAGVGKSWAVGALQVVVGALIGVLIFLDKSPAAEHVLSRQLNQRSKTFLATFSNIVTAQFFIALVNTGFTAVYILVLLPLLGLHMPYAGALLALTFFAGLLPVVGNLLCNAVLTIVSLSVSPSVAVASLVFLVLVHKTEYFINAAVVGGKTQTTVWELLIAIFLGEAIFGVAGLVAAPLYYAYIKQELKSAGLI